MTLGEALKQVSDILDGQYLSPEGLQAKTVIQTAIDENLCELIEDAIRKLRYSSKAGDQSLADSLEEILEGITK